MHTYVCTRQCPHNHSDIFGFAASHTSTLSLRAHPSPPLGYAPAATDYQFVQTDSNSAYCVYILFYVIIESLMMLMMLMQVLAAVFLLTSSALRNFSCLERRT